MDLSIETTVLPRTGVLFTIKYFLQSFSCWARSCLFSNLKTCIGDDLFTTMVYDGSRILYEVDKTGLELSVIASYYVYGINLIVSLEGISRSLAYYLYNGMVM